MVLYLQLFSNYFYYNFFFRFITFKIIQEKNETPKIHLLPTRVLRVLQICV